MTYSVMAIDVHWPTPKTMGSGLIRTYDPEVVIAILNDLVEFANTSTDPQPTVIHRYLGHSPFMACTHCNRWDSRQEYTLDENDKQAKCPHCHTWVFIEDCDQVE